MPCRETELIAMLRRVLADGAHSTDTESDAKRLLDEIDEEANDLRRRRNPYGDYDGSLG